jgi:hypothetical protein
MQLSGHLHARPLYPPPPPPVPIGEEALWALEPVWERREKFPAPAGNQTPVFQPIFNWASRHEDVLGKWRYSSTHSLTSALDGGER